MSLVKAPLFKNNRTTLGRLDKFVSDEYFTDCNLRGRLYGDRAPLKRLTHVDCGNARIPFAEAAQKLENDGQEVKPGLSIGPSWSTHWFKAEIVVPAEWEGKTVHFQWDSGNEALVWSEDGKPLKGMASEYHKTDFPIASSGEKPVQLQLYIEVACNTTFGCGKGGMINPPDMEQQYKVKTAEIVIFNEDVFSLLMDFDILNGLAKHLPDNSRNKYEAMYYANDLINNCDVTSSESVTECHKKATQFMQRLSSKGILDDSFVIHAIGNSHIDTAWLWPYEETKRKCARTFSTALDLMDKYPDSMRFAVSQAQQLEWVRQNYPSLFDRIRAKATEGKFLAVGGCWVEMDGNIPSGESLIRQMLYGQRFFQKYFGYRCTEFWLPDTFGYPFQLPQLMISAGMKRFVTQKMSWNLVNRFPHHTFWWKGLDGTKVLTHFPPADTYCSRVTVEEAMKIQQDFNDKGRTRAAMLLYGYGDGGGGPDERMLERLDRMKALPGLPQLLPSTPSDFFSSVERTDLDNLAMWSGELYLELHNGTYTTHCEVKSSNRKCEFLLRDCEFLTAILWASGGGSEQTVRRSWEAEWKNVLLNQFHDVLPGTSIGKVYEDAKDLYKDTTTECELFLEQGDPTNTGDKAGNSYLVNSLPWTRTVEADDGHLHKLPPFSVTKLEKTRLENAASKPVQILDQGAVFILQNEYLRATIDKHTGQVSSLVPLKLDSSEDDALLYDAVQPDHSLNRFVLYDDIPLYWDAWDVMDYHLETGKLCQTLAEPVAVILSSPEKCTLGFTLKIGGGSHLKQHIILRCHQPFLEFKSEIHWIERHKLLKVEFPLNVRANEATYEIQFGHIKRPAHRNTTWDAAKFEVCGHKWADVSECDFGVALLNDCKYGHSCYDGVLRLSVIRGSTAPDANADFDVHHEFTYALMPHFGPLHRPDTGPLSVIQAAYEQNIPVRQIQLDSLSAASVSGRSWLTIDNSAVMIEAVKLSEEGNAVIIRLYECHGGKARAKLTIGFPFEKAYLCNVLEEPVHDTPLGMADGNAIALAFYPFQVQTLRLLLA